MFNDDGIKDDWEPETILVKNGFGRYVRVPNPKFKGDKENHEIEDPLEDLIPRCEVCGHKCGCNNEKLLALLRGLEVDEKVIFYLDLLEKILSVRK